jgi:hypothetical protein
MASIVKRKKKYSVVYTYTDENGNKRQKWETFETNAEAKKRKLQVEYEQESGTFIPPSAKTVNDLLDEYMSIYGVNTWAMSTYESRKSLIANYIRPLIGDTKIAMMHGFQEMEVFDDRSIEENEANFFAAELLLEDGKVLECLSEHTFFETAKMLYVPAALLDYKFSLLHEKGELVNSMYIRKADFLKEDLHAYDNDIGYGDI